MKKAEEMNIAPNDTMKKVRNMLGEYATPENHIQRLKNKKKMNMVHKRKTSLFLFSHMQEHYTNNVQ